MNTTQKRKWRHLVWFLASFPIVLAGVFYATYPFADQIGKRTLSISSLSAIQKSNVELAARAINGIVLRPGEEFSFNKVVGPRTVGRGYRPAPSYLGPENPSTVGGGVCLMSSAVYQLALDAGCKIDQRVPHLRTIKTVPAGLDATVWYGQADLRFKNTLDCPVQLNTSWSNQTVSITMLGRRNNRHEPVQLERLISRRASNQIVVELLRRQGRTEDLISRDLYSVSQ